MTTQKLDNTTKTMLYISLSITGIIAFTGFTGAIFGTIYGMFWLSSHEVSTSMMRIIAVLSGIAGVTLSFLLNRSRYRIFKERHGFY